MITLGRNQTKVLKALEGEKITIEQLSQKTGIKIQTVKNIISEFFDAEVVKKSEEKYYSLREAPTKSRHSDEKSFWEPIKLKNLSRIV